MTFQKYHYSQPCVSDESNYSDIYHNTLITSETIYYATEN